MLDIRGSPNIDSNVHRMDSSSDSDGPDMPFMGPSVYDFSQQSIGRSNELQPRQFVKLESSVLGKLDLDLLLMFILLGSSSESTFHLSLRDSFLCDHQA